WSRGAWRIRSSKWGTESSSSDIGSLCRVPTGRRSFWLGENAPLGVSLLDALETDGVSGGAEIHFALARIVLHQGVGALHAAFELGLDLLEIPALGALVLQPLVVGDDDTAGVDQDVGQDVDTAIDEDLLGLGIGRPVGALSHHFAAEGARLFFADLQ